jgi:large subunit ribosomal protein L19
MGLFMDAHHLVTTTQNPRIPEFRPGDTVKVGVHIREGTRERVQTFEGVVIRKTGGTSPAAAFTVRGVFRGQYAVERIFPLYSPRIESVEVVRGGKVRRARLYYLRGKFGRAAKLKERPIRLGKRRVVDDVVDETNAVVLTDPQETGISGAAVSTIDDTELDASHPSDPEPEEAETESRVSTTTKDELPEEAVDEPAEASTADISSTEVNESKSDDSSDSSEPDEEETRASS